MSEKWENAPLDMHIKLRLRSACASAQSGQISQIVSYVKLSQERSAKILIQLIYLGRNTEVDTKHRCLKFSP